MLAEKFKSLTRIKTVKHPVDGEGFAVIPRAYLKSGLQNAISQKYPEARYVILVPVSNSFAFSVGNSNFQLNTGEVIILSTECIADFFGKIPEDTWVISIEESFLQRKSENSWFAYLDLFKSVSRVKKISLSCETFKYLIGILDQIQGRISSLDHVDVKDMQINKTMLQLVLQLLDRQSSFPEEKMSGNPQEAYVHKFKDYILNSAKDHVTVSQAAKNLGISPRKLNAITKEFTKMSSKEYLDYVLIEKIKKNLKETEKSIKEISFEAGFDEPSNFSKYVKKHISLSPSRYREIYKAV